jgi:hypothetical protein
MLVVRRLSDQKIYSPKSGESIQDLHGLVRELIKDFGSRPPAKIGAFIGIVQEVGRFWSICYYDGDLFTPTGYMLFRFVSLDPKLYEVIDMSDEYSPKNV